MPRRRTQIEPMEESPLANRPLHSTINPEKMDQTRFSEMRDLEEERTSPMRIVIYAIIVIIIGVGAAFLVRTLISNNQQPNNNQTQQPSQDEPEEEEPSSYVVSLTPKNDTTATNLAKNSDYVDSATVSLGDATLTMTNVALEAMKYDRYTSFARLTMDLNGGGSKLPKTTINYDSAKNQLTVAFQGLTKITEELLEEKSINDIIDSISYDTDNSYFVIKFSEKSKYRVVQSGGDLIIDVKTLTELAKPETQTPVADDEEPGTTPPTTTPPTTTPPSGTKPAAPHLENPFSQNTQYLSTAVSTNTLGFNNYWIWDEGTFFEFSMGQTDVVGDQYVPNTTAYLKEESGKNYLYLEVENLSNAPFNQSKSRTLEELVQTSGAAVDPAKVNFVKIDLVSFTGGKATYKIELKKKADYKLIAQKTYDDSTTIISLQIKD